MKKLNKLLSVFVITGAVSASLGALAACGHTHTFSEDWTADGANGHYHAAACDDYDGEKNSFEAHVDSDHNGECDKCDFAVTIGGAATVVAGQNITLTATLAPTGTTGTVAWSSSDTTKATVNASTGVVTGVAAGTTTITATVGGISVTKQITVTAASSSTELQSITITGAGEVAVGANITLTANKTPATATETITWSSSDATKATVNQTTGVVTGVAEGTVTITATSSNNKTATKQITVTASQQQPTIQGIIVEGLIADQTEITLTEAAPTYTLDLSALKVYKKVDNAKGDEIAAADYTVTVNKGGSPITTYTGLTVGTYEIIVTYAEDYEEFVEFSIVNPIKANSLEKTSTGDTTQTVGTSDTMSANWTFSVKRSNGETVNLTATDVTISGITTTEAGTRNATVKYGTDDSNTIQVSYTINADATKVAQSYALNFNTITVDQIKDLNGASVDNGRFVVASDKAEIKDRNASFDGKFFAKSFKVGGKSDTADAFKRYIKVKVDGPATITVYNYTDSGSSSALTGRKVTLTKDYKATDEYKIGTKIGEFDTYGKVYEKHTFTVTEAGEYYILACGGDINFTYVQLDQLLDAGAGVEEVTLGGEVKVSAIELDTSNAKKVYKKNDTFDSSNVTATAIGVNSVSLDSTDIPVANADLKFSTVDMSTLGEKQVTVTYGEDASAVTAKYNVNVESAVEGVKGILVNFKDTVTTQVAAGASFNLKHDDFDIELVKTLSDSDLTGKSVKSYIVKYNNDEVTDGTDFAISATEYEVEISAIVTDGTVEDTITTIYKFTVSELSTSTKQSFISPDTLPSTTAVAKGATINENNLFKVVADEAMEYASVGSLAATEANKQVKATLSDGTQKVLKSGIRTSKASAASVKTTTVTITAKEKITLKIYVVCCNDGYSSNKAGKIYYKVGDKAEQNVASGSNRLSPTVIQITLEANESVVLSAAGDAEGVRLYLFGVEAEAVATTTTASLEALPATKKDN